MKLKKVTMKTENNEQDQLMSRSTLFKILDKCKATTREALECVDRFVSDTPSFFQIMIIFSNFRDEDEEQGVE